MVTIPANPHYPQSAFDSISTTEMWLNVDLGRCHQSWDVNWEENHISRGVGDTISTDVWKIDDATLH